MIYTKQVKQTFQGKACKEVGTILYDKGTAMQSKYRKWGRKIREVCLMNSCAIHPTPYPGSHHCLAPDDTPFSVTFPLISKIMKILYREI